MLDAMEPALAAKAAVQAFAAVLPKYARHAEAIAEIARLGELAGQALQRATALARSHNLHGPAVELPGAVRFNPTGHVLPFASLVRLPAPDGSGLLVRTWGQEHQPLPAFRYAS